MKRIVILISGRGSNMQAIVDAADTQHWPAQIVAVISNRSDAQGLAFAAQHQISTELLISKEYSQRTTFDSALSSLIDSYTPDLVVLAGFMRILTPEFVRHYQGRLLNIHPSLLPLFPGLHTHQQALQAGVKLHGATVHFVSSEVDGGPIIAQVAVPVLDDDDEISLAARVLQQEHQIYPFVVRAFVEERIQLIGHQVSVLPPAPIDATNQSNHPERIA
ncbi:MAG: phosphoribosylglycinamide formyltransferase [Herbaspirillum sp.]